VQAGQVGTNKGGCGTYAGRRAFQRRGKGGKELSILPGGKIKTLKAKDKVLVEIDYRGEKLEPRLPGSAVRGRQRSFNTEYCWSGPSFAFGRGSGGRSDRLQNAIVTQIGGDPARFLPSTLDKKMATIPRSNINGGLYRRNIE